MKKEILIFMFMTLFLMGVVLYGFMKEHLNLIIPSLMILVMLLVIGFIFSTYILEEKYKIDENVLDLTKEILHELAIPISTIQANTLLLKRSAKDDEKALKRLGRIEDSSVRLERLYEELIYSIKKEIQTVEREKTDLILLIEERVNVMKLLNRNQFLLSLDTTNILVDKIGFEKMLDNILNNAMKYSPKTCAIEIYLRDGMLRVKDRGIGMDGSALKKLYTRYYQSNSNSVGQGIGLALVQAYCKDEGINIEIKSKKGEGTEVLLNLQNIEIG